MEPDASHSERPPLSVAELTAQIKGLVEHSFPDVWVSGEVSNYSRPASGHRYFTLKDDHAQIRAVVWRGSASRLKFDLTDGLEIVCHGRLDVYAPRGSYQLSINQAHPKGVGPLELALRQLKEKLAAEGLFDPERKQPLPGLPRRVGFVTSPTGAAIRDFLEVARRRWQGLHVIVIPTRVQGDGAAEEIASAIRLANQIRPALDALVVGRGGGSMEDLWCFNEAPVVRAIASSQTPIVSAVGHEIDVTLSDLAADVRALTPSEAAELVVPARDALLRDLNALEHRLTSSTQNQLRRRQDRLEVSASRRPFARPFALLEEQARRLDELSMSTLRSIHRTMDRQSARVAAVAGKLDSLSPLSVLGRGYCLAQDAQERVIRNANQLTPGEEVSMRFADGQATAKIVSIAK